MGATSRPPLRAVAMDITLSIQDGTGQAKSLAVADAGAAGLTPYHKEDATQRAALIAALPKPPGTAVAITPGTPVPAGRSVRMVCTQAGNVALKLADGASVLVVPLNVGVSADDISVIDVVAGQTTAVVTVYVLS